MTQDVYRDLPIAAIKIPELLLRGVDDTSVAFAELMEDIRANGVQTAIRVREVITDLGQAIYYVINGRQRLGASERLGLQSIPCQIVSCSDAEAQTTMLRLNAHTTQPRPAEYAAFLREYLLLNPAKGFVQLAAEINKTPDWIRERLKLTELIPELQELVNTGKISVLNAITVSRLDEGTQAEFTSAAQSLPNIELAQRVAERKKKIDAAAKACKPKPAEGFVAFPILRSKPELTAMRDAGESDALIAKIINDAGVDAGNPAAAVKAYINWEWSLDAETVAARQQKFDEDKIKDAAEKARKSEEAARRKEAAAAERATKSAEDEKMKVARRLLG